MKADRREFIRFMGMGVSGTQLAPLLGTIGSLSFSSGCTSSRPRQEIEVAVSTEDTLTVSPLMNVYRLISYGAKINLQESFGYNNDYINYIKLTEDGSEILLWVNHEYVHPVLMGTQKRTPSNIKKEMKAVGGSILHLKKRSETAPWEVLDSPYNRRITGETSIPFSGNRQIVGSKFGRGTLGNCAGGKTPWDTILTCEENYDMFYGERASDGVELRPSYYQWEKFYPAPPEHYGWVVEVDLRTGTCQKLIELGRFAHESATVVDHADGVVVYMGDDANDQFLYKFVADKGKRLESGTLYVANFEKGEWRAVDIEKSKDILGKKFVDQTDVLIRCREAAKLLGATPLDRPEDIEVHPKTGDVYVTLTNNKPKGRYHGRIIKISETSPRDLKFQSSDFIAGGEETGFSCPDNIAFDRDGNLWFCTDISGSSIGKGHYKNHGNNALFVVPASGKYQGVALRVANAPVDAELTGPCFSPSGKELFLSVQHPGERTKSLKSMTSHWPFGKSETPLPSVVVVDLARFEL